MGPSSSDTKAGLGAGRTPPTTSDDRALTRRGGRAQHAIDAGAGRARHRAPVVLPHVAAGRGPLGAPRALRGMFFRRPLLWPGRPSFAELRPVAWTPPVARAGLRRACFGSPTRKRTPPRRHRRDPLRKTQAKRGDKAKQALAPALKFKAVDEKAFDKLARNVERLAAGSVATTEFVARVFFWYFYPTNTPSTRLILKLLRAAAPSR